MLIRGTNGGCVCEGASLGMGSGSGNVFHVARNPMDHGGHGRRRCRGGTVGCYYDGGGNGRRAWWCGCRVRVGVMDEGGNEYGKIGHFDQGSGLFVSGAGTGAVWLDVSWDGRSHGRSSGKKMIRNGGGWDGRRGVGGRGGLGEQLSARGEEIGCGSRADGKVGQWFGSSVWFVEWSLLLGWA